MAFIVFSGFFKLRAFMFWEKGYIKAVIYYHLAKWLFTLSEANLRAFFDYFCLEHTLKVKVIMSSKTVTRSQGTRVNLGLKMIRVIASSVKMKNTTEYWCLTTVIFKWTIWPLTKAVKSHFEKVLENCGLGDSKHPYSEKYYTLTWINPQILLSACYVPDTTGIWQWPFDDGVDLELTFDDGDDDSSHLLSLPSAKIPRNTCVGVYKHTDLIVGIFCGSRDRVSGRLSNLPEVT